MMAEMWKSSQVSYFSELGELIIIAMQVPMAWNLEQDELEGSGGYSSSILTPTERAFSLAITGMSILGTRTELIVKLDLILTRRIL